MLARPLPSLLVSLLALGLVGGCALSHERDDRLDPAPVDGGPWLADTGPRPPPRTDAGPPDSGEDAGSCGLGDGTIAVRVDSLGPEDEAVCTPDAFLGQLLSVAPAPRDGVELVIDPCFYAESPCPCRITVEGVGADVATSISPSYSMVEVQWRASAVMIDEPGPCGCAPIGCCPGPLVLYAADGPMDEPPFAHPGVRFSPGEEQLCRIDGCRSRHTVRAALTSGPDVRAEVELAPGDTAFVGDDLDGLLFRTIRSAEVYECGADIPSSGAWVAWVPPRTGG